MIYLVHSDNTLAESLAEAPLPSRPPDFARQFAPALLYTDQVVSPGLEIHQLRLEITKHDRRVFRTLDHI